MTTPDAGPELVRDSFGGMLLLADGQPQSHVNLANPEDLAFEYVQHLACLLDCLAPGPPAPLAVTHVGGAGMTLARYVNATRPGSPQIVLEPDAALTELVRQRLPLPRRHRIRVRPLEGRAGVAQLADASADVVVLDAFAEGRMPPQLVTMEFFADCARVLRQGGALLVNSADEPDHRHLARVLAALAEVFPHTLAAALPEVWKGRRFGNTVLGGSVDPLDVRAMTRAVASCPFPGQVREGADLRRVLGSARPFRDADTAASPEPPPRDGWRVR